MFPVLDTNLCAKHFDGECVSFFSTVASPMRTPSSDSTQRGFSSLDTDRDVETPILDEFAQYLNASIHPPNELSVPRCYPEAFGPPSPTRLSGEISIHFLFIFYFHGPSFSQHTSLISYFYVISIS